MILYNFVDKFLMNDFNSEIKNLLNHKNPIIFDVGCFNGNFSRKLYKDLKLNKVNFYLFDANPNLKITGFKYFNEVFSDKIGYRKFNLNNFFPSSGSSLKKTIKDDKLWNFSRRLITLKFNKPFSIIKVKTNTLDNFCKIKQIKRVDLLKIDVEGSELDVLKGAKKLLNSVRIIQLEILQKKNKFLLEKNKILIFLKKFNFRLIKEKKITSVGILSSSISEDLLLVKD
tara:strand:- start:697 stop:1380 length:684 start_codon:yes stop_codon:yes gene_type:complete